MDKYYIDYFFGDDSPVYIKTSNEGGDTCVITYDGNNGDYSLWRQKTFTKRDYHVPCGKAAWEEAVSKLHLFLEGF